MDRLDYITEKIVSVEEAKRRISMWHMKNDVVCFTNGCFDILHLGHITYLAKAASLGKRLIVAVNSDDSVRLLNKAPNRPINNEQARMMVVAALGCVDLVVLFNEQTPLELISELLPDVLIKGADYDANETDKNHPKYIVGSDVVKANGGRIETISFVEGYSTTSILSK
ncbi:MAG: adenylyltransferase/cytidyltransferase family protein [Flavobacteriales bacterium]|nr:adenylyltransferase/cytidyltransferase family protein [Flavobacteriales bacterium]